MCWYRTGSCAGATPAIATAFAALQADIDGRLTVASAELSRRCAFGGRLPWLPSLPDGPQSWVLPRNSGAPQGTLPEQGSSQPEQQQLRWCVQCVSVWRVCGCVTQRTYPVSVLWMWWWQRRAHPVQFGCMWRDGIAPSQCFWGCICLPAGCVSRHVCGVVGVVLVAAVRSTGCRFPWRASLRSEASALGMIVARVRQRCARTSGLRSAPVSGRCFLRLSKSKCTLN